MKLYQYIIPIFFLLNCSSVKLLADAAEISEIKGAYIVNFLKFARFDFPITSHTLCIIEEHQIAEFINKKSQILKDTLNLQVKILKHSDDLNLCTVIYAADGNKIKQLEGKLLITDLHGGGIIEFIPTGENTLTFGISSSKAAKSKISFPAQVMNLATLLDRITFNENPTSNVLNFKKGNSNNLNNCACNLSSHCSCFHNKSYLG